MGGRVDNLSKMCPLLSEPHDEFPCKEWRCAWWIVREERCAVASTPLALSELTKEISRVR